VFFAGAARLGITPDLTDPENANVKTPAAFTASDRRAQGKKKCQIRHLKMSGTQIPGPAYETMGNHHPFLLLLKPWGETGGVWTILNQNSQARA
jgi:hypothetical protein